MNEKSIKLSTWIGAGALGLWIVEPLLVSELEGFPLFEALSFIFTSCFIVTAIRVSIIKKWKVIFQQPLFVWIFGTVAICGSDFCYILGAYCAPIAHVDLIDYMWPCFIVFFIGFLPNQKFSFKYLIGALLGFVGIVQLVNHDSVTLGIITQGNMQGYLLAFFGVIIWGSYSIYSSYKPEIPIYMIGIYCGIAAIVCGCLHFKLESSVVPTVAQCSMTIGLGLVGPGLAYQLWDYGMKFGNAQLLSVSCYFARILSMALLVFFGKQQFSNSLVIACAFAIIGVFISSVNNKWLQDILYASRRKIIEVVKFNTV